jgi:hypothetical protein
MAIPVGIMTIAPGSNIIGSASAAVISIPAEPAVAYTGNTPDISPHFMI